MENRELYENISSTEYESNVEENANGNVDGARLSGLAGRAGVAGFILALPFIGLSGCAVSEPGCLTTRAHQYDKQGMSGYVDSQLREAEMGNAGGIRSDLYRIELLRFKGNK